MKRMNRSKTPHLAAFVVLALVAVAAIAQQRPFEVDDLFRLQDVGEAFGGPFAFSASGELALVIRRPRAEMADYRWEWLAGNAAGDVWVQKDEQPAVNLTRGVEDGSGWWAPEWSPDGRYLAMLSTRGGVVRLWLHDRQEGTMRPLLEEAVAARGDGRHFRWLGKHRLLVETLGPEATSSGLHVGLTTPERAMRGWADMAGGQAATASVLESGVPMERSGGGHSNDGQAKDGQGRVLLVNVLDDTRHEVATGAVEQVSVSPQHDRLLLVRTRPGTPPGADRPLRWDSNWYFLELHDLEGQRIHSEIQALQFVEPPLVRWSPEGKHVAVLGQAKSGAMALRRVDAGNGQVEVLALDAADNKNACDQSDMALHWLSHDKLIAAASCRSRESASTRQWLLFDRDRKPRSSAGQDVQAVDVFWNTCGPHLAGLAGDSLVELRPSGELAVIRPEVIGADDALLWPPAGNYGDVVPPASDVCLDAVVVQTEGDMGELSVLDLAAGEQTPLQVPDPHAKLQARDPATGSNVFVRNDDEGLWIWRVHDKSDAPVQLFRGNRFLERIDSVDARRFEYRNEDGQTLSAWLLRPAGISEDQPLPLLTWIYPGSTMGDELPWDARASSYTHLHMRIPLAHGFAVLMPSMPLAEDESEPAARLAGSVMPAVEKMVEQGLADPDRLYLMGHSYGGYGTLSIIARTNRFAAAVALASSTNLIGTYGEFDPRKRYQENALQTANFGMLWLEDGQGRMFTPPWRDPERYVRNSPLFRVEDIHTPVMLVQGDLDAVPMAQSEQFFQALYRLGRRARLVRYWGEGHLLHSPANIRDMWQRVFDWLDAFPPDD